MMTLEKKLSEISLT